MNHTVKEQIEIVTPEAQSSPPHSFQFPPYPYPNFSNDEINLIDYWRVIWRGKWFVALIVLVSVLTAGWYSINQPKLYQAQATIIPTDAGGGGLASALSSIPFAGGLAGALPSTSTDMIISILESRTIAQEVIRRLDLMPVLFNSAWDPVGKKWEGSNPPTLGKAAMVLQPGVVKTSLDKRGIVSVIVEFKDPEFSASIANTYVHILGEYLNDHAINANFQVLDPAIPPETNFKPRIRPILILTGAASLFLSIFLVVFMDYIRKAREKEKRT